MWYTCVYPLLISGNVIDVLSVVIVLLVVIVTIVRRLFKGQVITDTDVDVSEDYAEFGFNVDQVV